MVLHVCTATEERPVAIMKGGREAPTVGTIDSSVFNQLAGPNELAAAAGRLRTRSSFQRRTTETAAHLVALMLEDSGRSGNTDAVGRGRWAVGANSCTTYQAAGLSRLPVDGDHVSVGQSPKPVCKDSARRSAVAGDWFAFWWLNSTHRSASRLVALWAFL